jgi:hypothetical protein
VCKIRIFLIAVNIHDVIFRVMIALIRGFEENYSAYFSHSEYGSSVCSSKTLLLTYQIAWRRNLEDHNKTRCKLSAFAFLAILNLCICCLTWHMPFEAVSPFYLVILSLHYYKK